MASRQEEGVLKEGEAGRVFFISAPLTSKEKMEGQ